MCRLCPISEITKMLGRGKSLFIYESAGQPIQNNKTQLATQQELGEQLLWTREKHQKQDCTKQLNRNYYCLPLHKEKLAWPVLSGVAEPNTEQFVTQCREKRGTVKWQANCLAMYSNVQHFCLLALTKASTLDSSSLTVPGSALQDGNNEESRNLSKLHVTPVLNDKAVKKLKKSM